MSLIVGGGLIQGSFLELGRTRYVLDYIHYTFDNTLNDSGPGVYHLSPVSTISYDANGAFGQAMYANSYTKRAIYSGQTISLTPENGLTVSLKYKKNAEFSAVTQYQILELDGLNFEARVECRGLTPLDTGFVFVYDGGSFTADYDFDDPNVWHQITFAHDGITNNYEVYIGGSYTYSGWTDSGFNNFINSITVGGNGLTQFNLSIDDYWIFNRKLTPIEIGYLSAYGTPYPSSITYTSTTTENITIPANATSMSIISIGGGGAGGAFTGAEAFNFTAGGGGGAGGAYAAHSGFTVTPGEVYQIAVGSGGNVSSINGGDSSVIKSGDTAYKVLAKGGPGKGQTAYNLGETNGAIAASVSLSSGTTKYAGGNGANGSVSTTLKAGGGGGAGLSSGTGNDGLSLRFDYPATQSAPNNPNAGGSGGGYSGAGGDIARQSASIESEAQGGSGASYGGGGGGGFSYNQTTSTGVGPGASGIVIYTINFEY